MEFEQDRWYRIYLGGNKANALVGTYLVFGDPLLEDTTKHNTTTGAMFKSTNQIENNEIQQKFQIVPIDSEYYVLRTEGAGPHGFMSLFYVKERTNLASRSLARMVRDDVSDASVFWKITSWRDGTYQLTNKANGTDWLLEVGGDRDGVDGTEVHMSANFTISYERRFSFEAINEVNGTDIGKIDDPAWSPSFISLPATSAKGSTTSATLSTSSPSNPTSSTSDSKSTANASSSGLSTGAKAGIGAGVGAVALIALVVLALFLFRKRKQRATAATEHSNPYANELAARYAEAPATKYGHVGVAVKPELDSNNSQRVELPLREVSPAELDSGHVPRHT